MEKHHKVWTEEDNALLLKLLSQGKSYREIGSIMGRSISSISNRKSILAIRFKGEERRKFQRSAKDARKFLRRIFSEYPGKGYKEREINDRSFVRRRARARVRDRINIDCKDVDKRRVA